MKLLINHDGAKALKALTLCAYADRKYPRRAG